MNANLETILTTATDVSMVAEFYDPDVVPTTDGFDPVDALECFAAVSGITFRGETYKQLVTNFGRIQKGTDGKVGSMSVTLSNTSREVADFEFSTGFEGLILVIRFLSRSRSIALTDTKIEFVGRCEKPDDGDKEEIGVIAKSITGSIEVMIPRRKFGPDDIEGRVASDPEFEGFVFMPPYGTTTYPRQEKRGGFLGWWNKKWMRHTIQWSSYSNLDANKSVPEVLGAAQMLGALVGAVDTGPQVRMRVAFTEGEIDGFVNVRSTEDAFPLNLTSYAEMLGKIGALNVDDPAWVGPGNYSRTSMIRCQVDNSALDVEDAAPDVAAVIRGRLLEIPNTSNVWSGSVWSDDAAAHIRFLYTDPNYYNLDEAWIDDDSFGDSFWFNNEYIFNSEVSDFTFVDEG